MKKFYVKVLVMVIVIIGLCGAAAPPAMADQITVKAGYQGRAGYKAGLAYSVVLGKKLSLQPELLFSLKKHEYTPYYGGCVIPETKLRDKVRYIEIPVLLKYKIIPNGRTCPILFAGAYAAFRTNKEAYIDDPEIGYIYRKYADFDGGLVIGTGFEHKEGKAVWIVDVRANFGFGWTQKIEQNYFWSYNFPPEKNKNKSISVMVGIGF